MMEENCPQIIDDKYVLILMYFGVLAEIYKLLVIQSQPKILLSCLKSGVPRPKTPVPIYPIIRKSEYR